MADRTPRCGKKYGKGLLCRRFAGHKGNHALRLHVEELRRDLRRRYAPKNGRPGGSDGSK